LTSLTVTLTSAPTDAVRGLITELEDILSAEYPPENRHGLSLEAIFQPHVRFFVATLDGVPAGCGGVALFEGFAEVKRMYVRPAARGQGVARAILARLEAETRAANLPVLRLETGGKQTDALRLYHRYGFSDCPAFGDYAVLPPDTISASIFLEKPVALMYDRQLLLLGAQRNEVLDLREIQRYGTDSFGNPDYVSVYGLPPAEWYARGIRLLGRTAVECTRDQLAAAMGQEIAAVVSSGPPPPGVLAIDPFAGSGNTLFWIMRHVPRARGIGFERDAQLFELTTRNLAILGLPLEIRRADYAQALHELRVPADQLIIAFIAPPWGNALDASAGLDLRRTEPPVSEIVDLLAQRFPNPILWAIQVYETIVPASLTALTSRFEWSVLRIYNFNSVGHNHGLLLGTRGWRPDPRSADGSLATAWGGETVMGGAPGTGGHPGVFRAHTASDSRLHVQARSSRCGTDSITG
jgi:GNAT superfamily N-acetyltransferase